MSMRTLGRSTNALRPASRSALSARFIASARVPQVVRAPAMRSFSTSVQRAEEFENPFGPNSLYKLTEEEQMLRDVVRRYAESQVKPLVQKMDENEKMDPSIIKGIIEQGLMAIETSPELGGAGSSFLSAIIVIEELAKVDPSVSVMCDVHNTLVNQTLIHI